MTSKSRVLGVLEENRGQYVSGEELAKQLSLSRSGIWKAIQELKKEGHNISAVTNKGYCLAAESDLLSVEGMDQFLEPAVSRDRIFIHKMLDSTNSEAKRHAVSGAAPYTVIFAEEQSGGRGRLGRSFFSPKGSGIYMSMILYPSVSAEKSILVTTAASVAVCRAIEAVTGETCAIKWVNDIYLRDRKICGILTEAVTNFETGAIESIVVGIGINFRQKDTDFPEEIRGKAGAVFQEDTRGVTRNQLAAAVINQLSRMDEMLETGDFIRSYKRRSLVLGKSVVLHTVGKEIPAKVLDIDNTGGLVVEYEDGRRGTIHSGEVSIRGLFSVE